MGAVLAGFLSLAPSAHAQGHSVTLGFTKSVDDTGVTGSGYTAWRANGTCPASVTDTTGFTALNSTLFTGTSYVDSAVTGGSTYCYMVTFTLSGNSSVPSNTAQTVVPVAPPTNVHIPNQQ